MAFENSGTQHTRASEGGTKCADTSSSSIRDANQQSDWTAYVQAHPWLAFGSAAALGFVVAPRLRHRDAAPEPLRSADSASPAIETSAAEVAGARLANDLLRVAAATIAEQSVAQVFELGRELLEKQSKSNANMGESASRRAHANGAAVPAEQGAADEVHPLAAGLEDIDFGALEQRVAGLATAHPVASLLAAAVGLALGIAVKR